MAFTKNNACTHINSPAGYEKKKGLCTKRKLSSFRTILELKKTPENAKINSRLLKALQILPSEPLLIYQYGEAITKSAVFIMKPHAFELYKLQIRQNAK